VSAAAKKTAILVALALLACVVVQAEERWKIQFFYDRNDSSLDIRDIRCPTAQHCVAAGLITEKNGRERGAVVMTTDGGLHWSLTNAKEQPVSLFFLNDSVGWMVTDRGVWSTQEGGRSWVKLADLKGMLGVHFLDASRGYTIGFSKAVYETADGGRKWVKVPAAAEAPGDPHGTVFDGIAFRGAHGIISGSIDPSASVPIRKNPSTGLLEPASGDDTVILETVDGGKSWTSRSTRFNGKLARLSILGDSAVVVVDYPRQRGPFPSAVFEAPLGSTAAERIFAERGRAVLDFSALPNGAAIIAAVEPPGNSNEVPIPAKLKMLESDDWKVWRDMDVDYRAVAQQAVLAAVDTGHIWLATDTGMILSLVKDASGAR
jgi:photosystem II stability/assembly factor-like uncharacterized protein